MLIERSRNAIWQTVVLGLCGGVALASGCVAQATSETGAGTSGRVTGSPGLAGDGSGGVELPGFAFGDGGMVSSSPGCGPQAPVPDFGTPVTCSTPPPPISGGTLIVTRDGTRAVAADSDRDAIYVIDLATNALAFTIPLQPGDEPGRLAEDGAGRVHVALRGSGTLATVDPSAGTVLQRRAVCPAPRGVAWQSSSDVLWVACATGELASLPAAGGAATTQHVERDLRDVIVTGDSLAVTQFRSASILRMASDQTVARTDGLPSSTPGFLSHVIWRAVPGPSGSIVTLHQAESTLSISTKATGGYGGCGGGGGPPLALPPMGIGPGGAVEGVLTVVGSDGTVTSDIAFPGVLPVDVAVSPDGAEFAAVAAGSGTGNAAVENVFLFTANSPSGSFKIGDGAATAVAYATNDELLVQTREPAALWVVPLAIGNDAGGQPVSIPLSTISRKDTGHEIFHMHAGALLACASCHPEGGDDGHVWTLDGNRRRTPSLRGTIAGTAPYHWPGDEADFNSIVQDVYVVRMSGGNLTAPQVGSLSAWVNAIPAPPAPTWVDPNAAAAGRALFVRADVGCSTCHSGSKLTNNATVDVGTGGAFQVPPLVGVGWRTPLLHDGCAVTIADRFGGCGTSLHGNVSKLSSQDITNLTAYLETL